VAHRDDTDSPVMLLDPRPGSLTGPSSFPLLRCLFPLLFWRAGPTGNRRGAGRTGAVRDSTYALAVAESKLEIQMLHDRVIVRLLGEEGERRSSGGILIPATAQVAKRLCWGEVYGVGQHVRTVQVGDRVLFNPEDQYEVEVRGCAYLVMRERDLQAVASERTEHGTGLYL
jgi:chaperonin GroES